MRRDRMMKVAGVLDGVAGAVSLVSAAILGLMAVVFLVLPAASFEAAPPPAWVALAMLPLAAWLAAAGVVAVAGAVHGLGGRSSGWALAGAVAATVTAPVLGVPAVILTVLAERDGGCR